VTVIDSLYQYCVGRCPLCEVYLIYNIRCKFRNVRNIRYNSDNG